METRNRKAKAKVEDQELSSPQASAAVSQEKETVLTSIALPKNASAAVVSGEGYETILKQRGAGESKLGKFCVRFWTTWTMFFAFLGLIYLGHAAVLCLVVVIQTRIYYELGNVRYNVVDLFIIY